MNFIFEKCTFIFDPLHYYWEHEKIHRKISFLLVLLFLGSLLVIELKRKGFLPEPVSGLVPGNHFFAIQAAFTVVLILEVVSLIFTLPCSFSKSVGKQFEILSLILIRNAFKELSYLPEPITFTGNNEAILRIVSDGFGALLIFALLGYYYKIQSRGHDEGGRHGDLFSFVAAKKGIALILLGIFLYMGVKTIYLTVMNIPHSDFFHDFYTLLIITDILLVLVAQCFQPSYYAVFRNSGFALSTLLIRLALAAPAYFNVLLGLAAALFAIGMTLISNRLFTSNVRKQADSC
ncbi:MAG: hypothetical protein SCH71_02465 [Desulfobulbaceae bacterium]|nr:hypothetical protein [Desulfobulbaceae bacterium]